MKILITGGTGFIGSHLTGALARRAGYQIRVLGRAKKFKHPFGLPPDWERTVEVCAGDINDFDLISELIADADVVFHKVASVGVAASGQSIRHYVQTNIGGAACLAEALVKCKHRVKKVILDSSIAVYGEGNYKCARCGEVRPELRYKAPPHIDGKVNWDPPCPRCNGAIAPIPTPEVAERKGESIYAITKNSQEDLLVANCKRAGVPLVVMRYSSVYGAGQSEANYCAELMRTLAGGKSPMLNEDGLQTRDYISVSDVVRSNLLALDFDLHDVCHFNVVSGQHSSLLDFVTQVSEAVHDVLATPLVTPTVTGRFNPADVRHCHSDGGKIAKVLSFRAETDLQEGISAMARQLKEDLRLQDNKAAEIAGS